MSRRASLREWLPVMGVCVAVCFAGLWSFKRGYTLLGNLFAVTAIALFVWLFERV